MAARKRDASAMGSRGSVIPSDISLPDGFELPIAYPRLTRFMITLEQGDDLVRHSYGDVTEAVR